MDRQPKFPVSMTLIVRNCGPAVVNCLQSLVSLLVHPRDEVVVLDTGSSDDTVAAIEKENLPFTVRVLKSIGLTKPEMRDRMARYKPAMWDVLKDHPQFDGGCIDDFATARQEVFNATRNDIVGWIDADDVFEGADRVRPLLEQFFRNRRNDCFFLRYDYAHDPDDGACTTALQRERFVRKANYRWAGKCHETLIPRNGVTSGPALCGESGIFIRHVASLRKEHRFSDIRNYAILMPEIEEAGDYDAVDPRTLYYLANACRGLGDVEEALKWYQVFLPRSGSREDRILALLHCADLYIRKGRSWRAVRYYQEAQLVVPEDPRPIVGLAQCYYHLGHWKQAIEYAEQALEKRQGFRCMNSFDPNSLGFFPYFIIANSAREMLDCSRAMAAAQAMVHERPNNEKAKAFFEQIRGWAQRAQVASAIKTCAGIVRSLPKRIDFLQSMDIPHLEDFGIGVPEKEINRKGKATLSIFCPGGAEAWGPKGPKGIGGSENMVLEMAPRLQERNLAVTVYSYLPPEQKGLHGDVLWRHFLEFNPAIERDYLLIWRNVGALQMQCSARRRYLWLHDVTDDRVWTDTSLFLCDRALFLSPWHRNHCPTIPDDKVYLTRNGIDVDLIEKLSKETVRDPHLLIYASSPDRGLGILLGVWAKLTREGKLPDDARLRVLYGFTETFFKLAAVPHGEYFSVDGGIRHRLDYMEGIYSLLDTLPNVEMVGRVPKPDVYRNFLEAGLLCYPTLWYETFCMVAAEAQACGCWPIVSEHASLESTVFSGRKIIPAGDPAETERLLLDYFENPPSDEERRQISRRARDLFGLEQLADQWWGHLFSELQT